MASGVVRTITYDFNACQRGWNMEQQKQSFPSFSVPGPLFQFFVKSMSLQQKHHPI